MASRIRRPFRTFVSEKESHRMSSTPANQSTVTKTFENLRGVPHAEIIVFTKDTDGPGATGAAYNTLGLPVDFTDEQFRALDPAALAAEFHGDAVWMNGPRRALVDTASAELLDGGRVTTVRGIGMHTVAEIHVPDLQTFLSAQRPPYRRFTVVRTTQSLFLKGREIHELVSPDPRRSAGAGEPRTTPPPDAIPDRAGRRSPLGGGGPAMMGPCRSEPRRSACRSGRPWPAAHWWGGSPPGPSTASSRWTWARRPCGGPWPCRAGRAGSRWPSDRTT